MSLLGTILMNHAEMAPPELILWLDDAATLQAAHTKINTLMDAWVPGTTKFREHKEAIARELEKANALNVSTTKELDAAVAAALEDVHTNASYLVLRAKHEKDDSWLHNNGYQPKEKAKRGHDRSVSASILGLRAKNSPNIAEVSLSWDKDLAAGSYQLQICKGHPQGEGSFEDYGFLTKVRVVIGNLERASWYHFRVRSIGHNEFGPWSEAVGIIVT
ncbi:fibronectin type III domain-containing protein [Geomonas anaerohicana]|uniref:Fibronectin type III domain-containing protein n=1 Tax=Geomonas anaerohicana TaxID=2798583 RepID=A0ABS0YGW4_9BACT|nr:fibronectin type III domain-containing protein [Geomonas anaerohicana]MBJ6751503.1 fibronectin type III domain-containing protein [Geomonas anaerohicana]